MYCISCEYNKLGKNYTRISESEKHKIISLVSWNSQRYNKTKAFWRLKVCIFSLDPIISGMGNQNWVVSVFKFQHNGNGKPSWDFKQLFSNRIKSIFRCSITIIYILKLSFLICPTHTFGDVRWLKSCTYGFIITTTKKKERV